MIAQNFHRIYHVYLALFLVIFYAVPKMTGLLIVLGLGLTIVGAVVGQLRFQRNASFLLPVLLYVAYLIGILFTDHPDIARGYAENKLSLVVFPLMLSFRPVFQLRIGPLLIGSSIGIVLTFIFGIISALSCYPDQGGITACFTSVVISPLHHPTYLATFILLTVFGLWWARKKGEPMMDLRWIIPFTLIAGIYFTLCLSLAAFLILFILIAILILNWIRKRMNKLAFWSLTLLSPVIIVLILIATPFFRQDVLLTVDTVSNYVKNPVGYVIDKPGDKTGNEVRLVMWTVTTLEVLDHPLGVGTGNVDDHLSERLTQYGKLELAKMDDNHSIRYNPHNQFLQTGLELGLAGMLLLVLFIFFSLKIAHREGNTFFMLILYCLIINSIFESMLQRQSGIVFFLFWICLMTVYSVQNSIQSENRS